MNIDSLAAPLPIEDVREVDSPGNMVRHARERAQLSLQDLASQTKLAAATLQALEADDFELLQEPVYVRGYYRKCARALNIPEELLMAGYQNRVRRMPAAPPTKLRLAHGGDLGTRRASMSIAIAAPMLALIIGAFFWFMRSGTSPSSMIGSFTPPSATPSTAMAAQNPLPTPGSSPASQPDAYAMPDAPDMGGARAAMPPVPPPAGMIPPQQATLPPPVDASVAATSAPAATTAMPVASGSQLLLDFVGTSWARVEDSTGKVLANRVFQSGERQLLDGVPPYAVFLGYAPGVKLEYQGQSLDIQSYVKPNTTARFSVPTAS